MSVFHSFLLLTCIPLYRLPHLLHLFASCGHLGYFQFLAIVSNAALSTHLKVFCVHMFPFLLGRCLEVILLVGMSLEIKGTTSYLLSAPMHSALQPHSWPFFCFSDSRVGGPWMPCSVPVAGCSSLISALSRWYSGKHLLLTIPVHL